MFICSHYKVYWLSTIVTEYLNTVIFVLTLTDDSSIFRVLTVMTANFKVRAVHKLGFCAKTQHIVQEDGPSSLTKEGIWEGSWTWVETMFAWITLQTRLHWRSVHFSWDGMLRYRALRIVWIKVYTSFALSTWKLQLQLQFWGSLLSWKLESSPGPHPQPNTIINTYTKSRNYTWIYQGITPSPGCRPKLTLMLRIWLPLGLEKCFAEDRSLTFRTLLSFSGF